MGPIILASSGSFITEGDLSFLPKPIAKMKIAWITTASKGTHDMSYLERHSRAMKKAGYDFEEIDLDGKSEQELSRILSDKDLIFVEGGNTFYLLRSIRESGFDKAVKKSLEKGMTYFGSSAGSYVACPTIEMATWKHQDKYDHCGVIDFSAMNLVPFLVTAHYGPEYYELVEKGMKSSKYQTYRLTDDQAVYYENGKVTFLEKG